MPSKVENQQILSAQVTLTSGQRNLQGGSMIGDEQGGQPWDVPWDVPCGTQGSLTEPMARGGKLG